MNNERREFLNTLGWDLVIAKLGVSDTALNQSIRRGFAASWYDVLDEIGRAKGISVPREYFTFKVAKVEAGRK